MKTAVAVHAAKRIYRFSLRQGFLAAPIAAAAVWRHVAGLPSYMWDWRTYTRMPGGEQLALIDSYPILSEHNR